jgi:hypothetical protein
MAPTQCWINNSRDLKFLAPSITPSAARKLLSDVEDTEAAGFWSIFKKERLSGLDKHTPAQLQVNKWAVARSKRSWRYDQETGEDLARSDAPLPSDQAWRGDRLRLAQFQGNEKKIQTRDAGLQAYFDVCGALEAGMDAPRFPHTSDASYPIRASKRLRRSRAAAAASPQEDVNEWMLVPHADFEEVFGLSDDEDGEASGDESWLLLFET